MTQSHKWALQAEDPKKNKTAEAIHFQQVEFTPYVSRR